MLTVAIKHYLKSVGDKKFVPNPDYPEFIKADCLDIVIKRKPKWFWQRPIYTYDNFGLNDLLDVSLPEDKTQYIKKSEPLTPNYSCTSKHSVNGKLGAKIASLVSLDVGGDDIVSLSVDLQDLMQISIDFSAVQKMLKTKKVDLSSKYLSRLAQDKYNVVCLITQYIYVMKASTITVEVEHDFHESVDVKKLQNTADDTGSYQSNKKKVINLDPGTRLAFEFCECLISPDGTIELLDKSDPVTNTKIPVSSIGAILPNLCAHMTIYDQNFDVPDAGNQDNLVGLFKSLSYLLNTNNVSDIRNNLLHLTLDNKKILTKLELFLLHCQQEYDEHDRDRNALSFFDEPMLKNAHLHKFLKCIGMSIKGATIIVPASSTNPNLLTGILCFIQCIYHLELPQLKMLCSIIATSNESRMHELILLLQGIKFLSFHNKAANERLATNVNVKNLLRSIGVYDTQTEVNKYFDPVFILIYGN